MFNRYRTEFELNNKVTNIFNIPERYDIYNHNENDDVERLKFYMDNAENILPEAIWIDILQPITIIINKRITEYITKYFSGEPHDIKISITDLKYRMALMMHQTRRSLYVISESIESQFNMKNFIYINDDILNNSISIKIKLIERLDKYKDKMWYWLTFRKENDESKKYKDIWWIWGSGK